MSRYIIKLYILHVILFPAVEKELIKNTMKTVEITIKINAKTEADIFPITLIFGLPDESLPETSIKYNNESEIPFLTKQGLKTEFEWINKQKLQGLQTATLQISPLSKTKLQYYKNITVILNFNESNGTHRAPSESEIELLKNRIVNWNSAKNWVQKKEKSAALRSDIPNGQWFQFFINSDDIYSISYPILSELLENISEKDPRAFSIFMGSNFGRAKSDTYNQIIDDNMKEISIYVSGEDDGSFDSNDKIIFYARGPSGFDITNNNLNWNQNIYFNSNSCWLFIPEDNDARGRRIVSANQPETGIIIDYCTSYSHLESDLINLEASGTQWVGNPIPTGTSQPIILNLANPKIGSETTIFSKFKGYSLSNTSTSHQLSIHFGSTDGNQLGSSISWTGNSSREYSFSNSNLNLNDGTNIFYIKNISSDANSYPYLDYFQVKYGRVLNYDENYIFQLPFQGGDLRLSFNGDKPSSIGLWNISDLQNIVTNEINNEGFCNIVSPLNNSNLFVFFNEAMLNDINMISLREDLSFEVLRNELIRSDYIIVGPESFRDEAHDLLTLREPATYAALEQIYLEYAAGNPDPLAIRSFIQWSQERWKSPNPTCVLFLGDAGYDYRNITGQSSIIVPTIQVQSSRSYATDDRLVSIYGNIPEIASGRFPAKNESEVSDFVAKTIAIENNPDFGPWRQTITLIADDAARPEPNHGSINTGKSHTLNSEQLASVVPPSIFSDKIYMMEFPEVSDASAYGVIKPDATDAVLEALNSGTALISYIGHGSPYQLAQEKLLDLNRGDINQISTGNRLPIWIVGTCSFGHFDDPLTESFAEELIRAPMNASSIVIATSRPITVVGNERYTLDLFEEIFKNGNVNDTKVGILLQSIKDGTSEAQYFHLFGDPALKLPMPSDTLKTLSISPDTLKTLETAIYSGIQNIISQNGNGYVTIKDAPKSVTREYEISSETYSLSYVLPGATLFRGQFSFSGQLMNGQVRIPEDISYSNNPALMLIYINDESNHARGFLNSIYLSGGSSVSDSIGPIITCENVDGKRLGFGDHFEDDEIIIIRFTDPIGINLTNETGHEILINDLKSLTSNIVTDDFYYDLNSITSGTINYSTKDEYMHLLIKAWDSANNPSEKEIKLYKTEDLSLKIYNAYNFPNPFSSNTQFSFEITRDSDVTLDIYSLGGRRIWHYNGLNFNAGYHIIDWNGLNYNGDKIANGVYIYRLKAANSGSKVSYIGKCTKYY